MQFLIDENLPSEVAEVLRQAGHDAVMVLDCVHAGTPDPNVAALCVAQKRALITLDVGFGNTQLYPPQLRDKCRDDREDVRLVLRVGPQHDDPEVVLVEEELVGKLWVVDEELIRIRGPGA